MRIARALREDLVDHALTEAPLECCGLIGCRDGEAIRVCRATNAASSVTRFEIDGPEQQTILAGLARDGLELGAIYHSHTIAEPYPSPMDVASAFYPDVLYLIVGVQDADWPVLRAFRIVDGEVSEEQLAVRG